MPPTLPPALPQSAQVQIDALRKQYHSLESLISRLKTLSGATLAALRQQRSLRQAILTSKQTIDKEAKSERELLFRGTKSAIELGEMRRRGAARGNTGEYMLNTSKEQNESLSRTLQLMQQEVERTAHSAKVIGKNLIAKLSQADWMDRLLIGFGLLVFSLVVMYILKKRIADRGVSLVSYFFMPIRWFFSLLMPSLRDVPTPAAVVTPSVVVPKAAVETLVETFVEPVAEKVVAAAEATSTSTVRGILDVLDAFVGE
ncbi:hypothetical protein BGZ94_003090 [Podila epigama]|nr:hypothetical protein BGZ94_003090 [Podila epigama]